MPIYEFKCKDCGKEFEVKLPMSKSGEKQNCPLCESGNTTRSFSAVSVMNSSTSDSGSFPSCPTGTCGLQ
ncbi:MAG: zinc ribbon domain-containing protein [Candidatus Margulisiibacteriota bacterium]|nr:zinc ribbon domain-containing protein [Candidatus Margulisiibacteriota bacterium]